MNTQTTATAYQLQTIDINAKEWFDKVNGNSYFAGSITLNFGQPDAITLNMPFQYGYGDYYLWKAVETLKNQKILPEYVSTFHQLQDAGTIIRYNIERRCKKGDLMQF